MANKRNSSLKEMVKGRWREFCREPSAFFFVLLMPLVWMAILGFAFSSPKKDTYGVGLPQDALTTPLAAAIQQHLEQNPQIRLRVGTQENLELWLKRGEIVLVIEPQLQAIRYLFDPNNPESSRAQVLANALVQEAAGRRDLLATSEVPVKVAGTRYIDFLIPGLIALSIMTTSLYGTGMTIVSNRRENLLKRYVATPINPMVYILSHIIGRSFVLAVELFAILTAGFLIFDFHIAGYIAELVVFAALGAATFTAIALLCGSRTSNLAAMNGMTNLIALPMMIVAGVWFSRANFPGWLATFSRYLPLTALVEGLRRIALEGAHLSALGFEIAILVGFLAVATLATRLLFKWY